MYKWVSVHSFRLQQVCFGAKSWNSIRQEPFERIFFSRSLNNHVWICEYSRKYQPHQCSGCWIHLDFKKTQFQRYLRIPFLFNNNKCRSKYLEPPACEFSVHIPELLISANNFWWTRHSKIAVVCSQNTHTLCGWTTLVMRAIFITYSVYTTRKKFRAIY